jgi:hypothetical protein
MNKYTLYALMCVAILALLALFFYLKTAAPATTATSTPIVATTTSTSPATPKAASVSVKAATQASTHTLPESTNSFKAIFSQSGGHECDYSQVTESGVNNDSVFIANGKMRGEFQATSSAPTIMVYDGTYLYIWTEGETTGTRTSLVSLSQLPVVIPANLSGGGSYGATGVYDTTQDSVNWQCHVWITDPSLLVAPSYVHFTS